MAKFFCWAGIILSVIIGIIYLTNSNRYQDLTTQGITILIADPDRKIDVSKWDNIVAVAAGYSHVIGLRSDGKVLGTGSGDYWATDVDSWNMN